MPSGTPPTRAAVGGVLSKSPSSSSSSSELLRRASFVVAGRPRRGGRCRLPFQPQVEHAVFAECGGPALRPPGPAVGVLEHALVVPGRGRRGKTWRRRSEREDAGAEELFGRRRAPRSSSSSSSSPSTLHGHRDAALGGVRGVLVRYGADSFRPRGTSAPEPMAPQSSLASKNAGRRRRRRGPRSRRGRPAGVGHEAVELGGGGRGLFFGGGAGAAGRRLGRLRGEGLSGRCAAVFVFFVRRRATSDERFPSNLLAFFFFLAHLSDGLALLLRCSVAAEGAEAATTGARTAAAGCCSVAEVVLCAAPIVCFASRMWPRSLVPLFFPSLLLLLFHASYDQAAMPLSL